MSRKNLDFAKKMVYNVIIRKLLTEANAVSEVKTYKCPCCNAPLVFDPETGGMKCEYCDTKFSAEDTKAYIDSLEVDEGKDSYNWEDYDKDSGSGDWSEEDKSTLRSYICPSCGGEVIGDVNTVATICPYCGNPTIMAENARDVFKPDVLIPFKYKKEDAVEALKKYYKKKPLLPSCFKDENKIEEVKGIYVPFWFFDCDTDSDITFNATRVRTWSDSNYIYTKTSYYLVRRSGTLAFENIPSDGSSKIDDAIMQSIEPFDASEMIPFSSNYLAGFLADKYDVDAEKLKPEVNERVKQTVLDAFRDTTVGYTTITPRSTNIRLKDGKVKYGLMPVYLLNTTYRGKTYSFAMNGQTGRFVGDLPVSWGRYAAWLTGIAAGSTAVLSALIMLFLR